MKNLLSPRQAEVLAQLAQGRALLAFDFDGTLAPIVPARHTAALRATTRRLFERVCLLFPTAVISGRGRGDVRARLGPAKVKYVIGNHGLERGGESARGRALLDPARVGLRALVERMAGLELEDKGYSLAIHYRSAARKTLARQAIAHVLGGLAKPVRSIPGKCVVNVLPKNGAHKGDALLELRAKVRAEVALYVGDDLNDEDVFRLGRPGELVTVRVGRDSRSAASFFLENQRAVDALLRKLIELRSSG